MDIKWLWRTWRGKFLHLPFSHDRRGGKGRGGERKEKEEVKEQGKKEGWERLLLRKGEGEGGRKGRSSS